MSGKSGLVISLLAMLVYPALAAEGFETDTLKTSAGDLKITFIGHGTLMFTFGGKIIHVDPWSQQADYAKLPKADLILITHEHRENIPEMENLGEIECAFLPMNLPYTMTPEMVADAAKTIKPKILYPYHFAETKTSAIVESLKDSGIDVRIRKLK